MLFSTFFSLSLARRSAPVAVFAAGLVSVTLFCAAPSPLHAEASEGNENETAAAPAPGTEVTVTQAEVGTGTEVTPTTPMPPQTVPVDDSPEAVEAARLEALKVAARDRQDTDGAFYEAPLRLYDLEGRLLEARLLSAAGDVITVERGADQKQFQIPLENFHHSSRKYIDLWLARDTAAIDYSIGFVARKRMLDDSDYETSERTLTTAKWVYDIELTNRTRNVVHGTQIEYRIFFEDEVMFLRTTAYPGKGRQEEGESVKLPDLGFNSRAEFTTPPVELDTYRYDPARGDKEYRKDHIIGIWLRVLKNDEVIAEHRSNEVVMKDFAWDGEDSVEITITDSFGDEFKDSKRIVSSDSTK